MSDSLADTLDALVAVARSAGVDETDGAGRGRGAGRHRLRTLQGRVRRLGRADRPARRGGGVLRGREAGQPVPWRPDAAHEPAAAGEVVALGRLRRGPVRRRDGRAGARSDRSGCAGSGRDDPGCPVGSSRPGRRQEERSTSQGGNRCPGWATSCSTRYGAWVTRCSASSRRWVRVEPACVVSTLDRRATVAPPATGRLAAGRGARRVSAEPQTEAAEPDKPAAEEPKPEEPTKTVEELLAELDAMIGLDERQGRDPPAGRRTPGRRAAQEGRAREPDHHPAPRLQRQPRHRQDHGRPAGGRASTARSGCCRRASWSSATGRSWWPAISARPRRRPPTS